MMAKPPTQHNHPFDSQTADAGRVPHYVIAYDLGTGGLKAGLYRTDGTSMAYEFIPYDTAYPHTDWHEQRPADWWQAVCLATRKLLQTSSIDPANISAVAASGHSLVAAPLDSQGNLLLESVPIWSDRRAKAEAAAFFSRFDYSDWYLATGNGDPPETYPVFKLMWLKQHLPDIFARTKVVLGSKDYINFLLTGEIATDYSYASGSGVFDLASLNYRDDFIAAAGLPRSIFVEPRDSYAPVGRVTAAAAATCGLREGTPVICGGVDNACMALGTTGLAGRGSRAYTSLGSSAWIALSANKPVLDTHSRPFVFAHVEKGSYTSAVSIFAAANAYRWARDTFCADLTGDAYSQMDEMAALSPLGANGLLFNPSLAGGSSQEPSEQLTGSFIGLTLSHTRSDLLRSVLEGVALSLKCFCLSVIEPMIGADEPMVVCGGGAKSGLWMQIFADIFGREIAVTNVDQDAAALGAAAIALRGAGLWQDYSPLDGLSSIQKRFHPIPANCERYEHIAARFERWVSDMALFEDSTGAHQTS